MSTMTDLNGSQSAAPASSSLITARDALEIAVERFASQEISEEPRALLRDVETIASMLHRLESRLTELTLGWALINPPLEEGEDVSAAEDFPITAGGPGTPKYRSGAGEVFALSAGKSAYSADTLLDRAGESLVRLPKVWEQVQRRQVPLTTLWFLVSKTKDLPQEVVSFLDSDLAPHIHRASRPKIKQAIAAAQAAITPEDFAAQVAAEKAERSVSIDRRNTAAGTCNIFGILDAPDSESLDRCLSNGGKLLVEHGICADLGIARAKALGMLSRGELVAQPDGDVSLPKNKIGVPASQVVFHVHFAREQLHTDATGAVVASGVASVEELDTPVLLDQIARWCQQDSAKIRVAPVLDLAAHYSSDGYAPSQKLREQAINKYFTCVFPTCTRKARRCDIDHIQAHSQGGCTCTENLAPLCRRHHRAKTRRQWEYSETFDEFIWTYYLDRKKARRPANSKKFSTPVGKPLWWHTPEYYERKKRELASYAAEIPGLSAMPRLPGISDGEKHLPESYSENSAWNSLDLLESNPVDLAANIPEDVPERFPKDLPDNFSGENLENIPENFPEVIHPDALENIPDAWTESLHGALDPDDLQPSDSYSENYPSEDCPPDDYFPEDYFPEDCFPVDSDPQRINFACSGADQDWGFPNYEKPYWDLRDIWGSQS